MSTLVALSVVAFVLSWFLHLLTPAFSAVYSPKYQTYSWVKGKRGFSQFFASVYDCVVRPADLFRDTYEKIRNTADEAFLIPFPLASRGFLLLLPKQLIDEYARQPESVVSFNTYVRGAMHAKYAFFGDHILDNNIQKPIVYRELFQNLPDKMHMTNDELVAAMKDAITPQLDENGEARINMWDTAMKFLSRTSNRIIVGHPLCRNQEYLDAAIHYAVNTFSLSVYIRLIPKFARPIIAPLLQWPLARDRDIVAKHALPIVEERMRIVEECEQKGTEPDLPNDLLSSVIKASRKDPNSRLEYTPMSIVSRILALNFLQSYSNTLTLTNVIHDLISLPKATFDSTVSGIRAEISLNMEKSDEEDWWSHEFVNKLELMDSFIRESMRANPVGEVALERTIVSKGGFTFSNGLHVPQGAILAATIKAFQNDPKYYPGGFDPERALHDPSHPKITTVSPDFLNFGLGRPACPGRWFTSNMLKLSLGHLLMDYDFEHVDRRPQGVRKLTLVEPCGRTKIVLKKRSVA